MNATHIIQEHIFWVKGNEKLIRNLKDRVTGNPPLSYYKELSPTI
jgi:hypothetical protein